jgi:hypothetical protein
VFTPFELIERLLPLIPRPRKHTIRFHGILAPAAGDRAKVAPGHRGRRMRGRTQSGPHPTASRGRIFCGGCSWVDVLGCPRCHARMRIVAAVTEPGAVERILRHLGESAQPPPVAGPPAPPHDKRRPSSANSTSSTLTPAKTLRLDLHGREGASLAGVAFMLEVGVLVFARKDPQGPGTVRCRRESNRGQSHQPPHDRRLPRGTVRHRNGVYQ